MVIVGKHINGITINPLEYLLGDDGEEMKFVSKDAAKAFLKMKGFADEELEGLAFEPVYTGESPGKGNMK